MTFDEAVKDAADLNINIIPYELAKDMGKTRELISKISPGDSIGVFIGPEGGFEAQEVELLCENNAQKATLGKRILRTQTAPVAALAAIMLITGNLE